MPKAFSGCNALRSYFPLRLCPYGHQACEVAINVDDQTLFFGQILKSIVNACDFAADCFVIEAEPNLEIIIAKARCYRPVCAPEVMDVHIVKAQHASDTPPSPRCRLFSHGFATGALGARKQPFAVFAVNKSFFDPRPGQIPKGQDMIKLVFGASFRLLRPWQRPPARNGP